jgi:O-antigen/teichoic acid export membrane protein
MSAVPGQGPDLAPPAPDGDRFIGVSDLDLASKAARGSVVNGGFLAAINVLGVVKGLAAASLLGAGEYGVWGLISVTSGFVLAFGAVGIEDKYLQQDHADQRTAFQVAFTLQCGLAVIVGLGIVVAMPLFALVYGQSEIVWPGMALALAMPAAALQAPLWIYWRRMDFLRQRTLQIWDPVVSLIAVVALAAAGLGVWALVLGTIAGVYASSLATVLASPYPLRWRYVPGSLREYASFSWPLFAGAVSMVLIMLVPALVASRELGLAAVGAIALANIVVQFAYRVDEVLTQVLYPAICSVRDRADLLLAAFSKSNRLALLWALPFGAAGALFAEDFVDYVLGEKWRIAVTLIQVLAVTAAVNQFGFNWTAFYRALNRTRPIAVANFVLLAAVLGIAVPLLASDGLDGYAVGMAAATALALAVRLYFISRLFPLRQVAHLLRAVVPTVPAVLAVLAVRALAGDGRSPGRAVAEAVLFLAVAAVASLLVERDLVRETLGYLRRRPRATTASTAAPAASDGGPRGGSPG